MIKNKYKIALCGQPNYGGNYSRFQYFSEGLREFDFTLLQVGKINDEIISDSHFVNIGAHLPIKSNKKELALLLLNYLIDNNFDILIPMNSPTAVSIIPFLPANIKVINIVNSNTQRVYKYVTEHSDFVSKIICISLQQKKEISEQSSLLDKLVLIPHGQAIDSFFKKQHNKILTIGFLGRIHDGHKGCFIIPNILKRINTPYILEIVGDGPDTGLLLNKLDEKRVNYKFIGFKSGKEKEEIISKWDIMLFPSKVEGFGLTLIECMKYGVIPIANKISGITDDIITDGIDGFIIEGNNPEIFTSKIEYLFENPQKMREISDAAKQTVEDRFDLKTILIRYGNVFMEAMNYQKPITKDFQNWKPYEEYKPSIFTKLKNRLYFVIK